MRKMTRRDFIKLSAGAAVALGTPQWLSGCTRDGDAVPALPAAPGVAPHVAAIRGDDLPTMTREALEALGAIGKIINGGETVFIKPNMVTLPWSSAGRNPFHLGECTKPEIVITVAEECLRAGAKEVIIGDGSQMPEFDWSRAVTLDGLTNLAAEAERLSEQYAGTVTLACLEIDTPEWIEVPTGISLGKVRISSLVTEADRVISIPVAKTHILARLTLSMKNFIGIIPLVQYGWEDSPDYTRADLHENDYTPEAVNRLTFDLANAVKPDLAIVDFSIGMEGNGPTTTWGGVTVDMKDKLGSWLLLASTDPVAADATAARVMNHDRTFADEILGTAFEMGLGETREEAIELIGERLDDIRAQWKPAKTLARCPYSSLAGASSGSAPPAGRRHLHDRT
jgi:uncharacterized protein (DUF362 family)